MNKRRTRWIVVAVVVVIVVAVALARLGLTRRLSNNGGADADVSSEARVELIIPTPAAVELLNHIRPTDLTFAEGTSDVPLRSSIAPGRIDNAYPGRSDASDDLSVWQAASEPRLGFSSARPFRRIDRTEAKTKESA